jgi:hypothetical protein
MQTYMLRHHADNNLKKLRDENPAISFDLVEINGGFIIQAKRPEHVQWSGEIVSSLNQLGVDIVVDHTHTEAPAPEATAAPETAAPAAEAAPAVEKPKKEPKPKVQWSVMWKTAPDKVAARVAKGEPPFKPGSKRDITKQLLEQENGCTIEEAMNALAWDKATVLSSFTEIATLLDRRKVVTTKGAEGQPNRYTMGPPMTTEQVEQERKERTERRASLAEEKQKKAAEREAKKKAAEEAAAAATAAQAAAAGHQAPPAEQHAAQ